jgi:acetyltransferase-like isoleucine patch superfamily enzyme
LSSEGLILGNNVSIGRNTTIQVTGSLQFLGKGIKIGNNVGMGTDGYFGGAGGLEIGDDTIFGNYVSCHPENHNYSDPDIPIRLQGVNHQGIKIGSNCWIGAKVTILDGAEIGNGCIVAAGAVVRGKFPDNVIIGGVPAKILKERI